MKRIICCVVLTLWCTPYLQSALRIAGDVQQDASAFASFSFAIGPHTFTNSERLFVGARDPIIDQEAQPFAISGVVSGDEKFVPLAPENVILNGQPETANPLHGAAINVITSLQDMPLVAPSAAPNTLLLVGQGGNSVLQTDPLLDGNKAEAMRSIGLHAVGNSYAAALVPNSGDFGDVGSGLAFGMLTVNDNNQYELVRKPSEFLPINRNTPQLIRNGRALAQIHNDINQPVVFTSPVNSALLYTGVSVTSGSQADAGARSILVGRNMPIVPEAALKQNAIVGTDQPDTQVWVHHVSITQTSTHLPYLVVVGGVGDRDATQRTVFALPLVNDFSSHAFGTVAARGSEPQPQFEEDAVGAFRGVQIQEPAQTPETMWSPDDPDVRVGGDSEVPGAITDLWVERDAVFVAIPEVDTNATLPSGVYYSQALFNAYGRVIGWTDWLPTAGTAQKAVDRVIFNARRGEFLVAEQDTAGGVTRIARTQVTQADDIYRTITQPLVADADGGVQGLVDIPYTHPALSDTVGQRLSLTIATGLQRVVLAQTARDVSGQLIPRDDLTLTAMQGGVTPGPTDGFVITGGDLDALGAIISADIGGDDQDNWLAVGGSGGVAILLADDGSGWSATDGLRASFTNMPDLSFVRISSITDVRKVMISDGNLYVLTQAQLYRIPLNRNTLSGNAPPVYTLADAAELCGADATLADIVISGSRGILATSCGLFQTMGGIDVRTQTDATGSIWQTVTLPESVGPVTRLFTISPTQHAMDVATTPRGGTIYAISAAVSLFRTHIYRLAVTPESGVGTSLENGVQLYPDYFTQRTQSYFVARGNYRNFVFSDGAIWLLTRSRYAPSQTPILVEMLPSPIRSGIPFLAAQSGKFFELAPNTRIEQPVRSSATGALLMYGDFGMYVQQ